MSNICKYDSRKNAGKGFDIYGEDRIKLALIIKEILNNLKLNWIIDNGTLLGAYRNGKVIQHDDDFDIMILIDKNNFNIDEITDKIRKHLPKPYECRIINTYTDKIEVYDPTIGKYILQSPIYKGADYHNITIDLQFSLVENDIAISTYRGNNVSFIFKMNDILPIKTINLEGIVFPCPNNPENYLKEIYGYIGLNAQYNNKTGKYEKKPI